MSTPAADRPVNPGTVIEVLREDLAKAAFELALARAALREALARAGTLEQEKAALASQLDEARAGLAELKGPAREAAAPRARRPGGD